MPLGGTLTELLVKPGDRVQAGQTLALMTSAELVELRTTALDRRADAIAALQQAQVELQLAQDSATQQQRIAQGEMAEAKVALKLAQERFRRDSELAQSGALPRREVLESESALAVEQSASTRAQSGLALLEAKAEVRQAAAAVAAAQRRLGLSDRSYLSRLEQLGSRVDAQGQIRITAPISGVIAASDNAVSLGASRQDAGDTLLRIVNSQQVQVTAQIYEKDLAQIKLGQTIWGQISSLPQRRFQGEITVIDAVVDPARRTVAVKAQLDNADGLLKPGSFVDLDLLTGVSSQMVLTVPEAALVETNDRQTLVFVQNGTVFEPVEVSLGESMGDRIEVKMGLLDGDQVVIQGAGQLYAQSLRSGTKAAVEGEQAEAPAEDLPQAGLGLFAQIAGLPGWVALPLGGAIGLGLFGAGVVWGGRGDRGAVFLSDALENPNAESPMPVHGEPLP